MYLAWGWENSTKKKRFDDVAVTYGIIICFCLAIIYLFFLFGSMPPPSPGVLSILLLVLTQYNQLLEDITVVQCVHWPGRHGGMMCAVHNKVFYRASDGLSYWPLEGAL